MTIRAVVFGIGGVLEITPDLGVDRRWGARLGLDEEQLAAYTADAWREYLGTANTELIEYAGGIRPRYRTQAIAETEKLLATAWDAPIFLARTGPGCV